MKYVLRLQEQKLPKKDQCYSILKTDFLPPKTLEFRYIEMNVNIRVKKAYSTNCRVGFLNSK